MKLAVVCPIGPLDRFGYQYTYATALESYSLFADVIYLICSSRIGAQIADVSERFPKAVLISDEQTWYSLDEFGQEVFDIYQWDRNLQTGLRQAQQEWMDAAVVVPINAYIPETAIALIQSKIRRMLEEDRPFEWVYRRFQLGSKLFIPDAGVPNIINLRLPRPYRVRYDWTESPHGEKIPISYDHSHPDAAQEAFVDCPMEMTVDDLRDKMSFTKSYSQINPRALPQFDFQVHVTEYYLPKFLRKVMTDDPLDRFGRMIAQNSSPDFVSRYIIREYDKKLRVAKLKKLLSLPKAINQAFRSLNRTVFNKNKD